MNQHLEHAIQEIRADHEAWVTQIERNRDEIKRLTSEVAAMRGEVVRLKAELFLVATTHAPVCECGEINTNGTDMCDLCIDAMVGQYLAEMEG